MRNLVLVFIMIVFVFSISAIGADEISENNFVDPPSIHFGKKFSPYTVISVGMSLRTDDDTYLDHSPTFRAKMYTYLTRNIATKLGVGYNNGTDNKSEWIGNQYSIRMVMFEAGVRFQEPRGFISPYFEAGLETIKYMPSRNLSGLTKAGLNLGMGIEKKISSSLKLDLSIKHTFNHNEEIYMIMEALDNSHNAPWPDEYWPGPIISQDYFNPTEIQLLLSFKL